MKPHTNVWQKIILLFFGLFLSMLILEITLRFGGFVYLSVQDAKNKASLRPADPTQYRILCIGESTTALGGKDAYPRQLEGILNEKLKDLKCAVINRGIPGTDTDAIISELGYNLNTYKPHIVIAMMGVNDDSICYESMENQRKSDFIRYTKDFIKSLRVYKLAKMLYDRIRAKEALGNIYLERGRTYLDTKHYIEAEDMLRKAIFLAPSSPVAYILMARYFYEQAMYRQCQEYLKKAEALSSGNESAYVELGWCYYDLDDFSKAEEMLKKAINIKPKDNNVYFELAIFYQSIRRFSDAEAVFKKAIGLMPKPDYNTYVDLGWCYFEADKFSLAEEMFKKALAENQDDLMLYRYLGFIKQAQGDRQESDYYFHKADTLMGRTEAFTRRNYRKLREEVRKRNITLVCVQYPMRRVDDLKKIVEFGPRVIFVDNEKVFKDALRTSRFEDYFQDRFGGDFGHCTPLGNRLLANNIADVLVKEVLSKQ